MEQIRITKRFTFEMAHALRGYDGPCRHIHGHSYVLDVTLGGRPVADPDDPKDGMVIDFGELKAIVQRTVLAYYDHALVLHEDERAALPAGLSRLNQHIGRLIDRGKRVLIPNAIAGYLRQNAAQ